MSGNDLLVCSIIQIKGKELLVSVSDDTKMIFWNLSNYQQKILLWVLTVVAIII